MKIDISEFKTVKQKMKLKEKNYTIYINVGIKFYIDDILCNINKLINDKRFYKRNDIKIKFFKNNKIDYAFILENKNKQKIMFKNETSIVEKIFTYI